MPLSDDEAEAIWQKLKEGTGPKVGQMHSDTDYTRTMTVHLGPWLAEYSDFGNSTPCDADAGLYSSSRLADGCWGPWVKLG